MNQDAKMVQFSVEKFKALVRHYNAAVRTGQVSFTFEGDEYLVDYARYLIEYLALQFAR
jgi:hypothetical protein